MGRVASGRPSGMKTLLHVSRADTAEEDSSDKKAERQKRERKYHQDCHLERGQHDWQRTRGRGCYGAEEG